MRITALLASVVHVPVAGLHSSAAWTAPAALLNPEALVPPVTSTSPVGKIVAFICKRAYDVEPALLHVGFGGGPALANEYHDHNDTLFVGTRNHQSTTQISFR